MTDVRDVLAFTRWTVGVAITAVGFALIVPGLVVAILGAVVAGCRLTDILVSHLEPDPSITERGKIPKGDRTGPSMLRDA